MNILLVFQVIHEKYYIHNIYAACTERGQHGSHIKSVKEEY